MGRCIATVLVLLCVITGSQGCSSAESQLQDGYYTAISGSFNAEGWKEFITIFVLNNKIVTAEYNARNSSGLILSWDGLAMSHLKSRSRVHPNRIIRQYIQELLTWQDPTRVREIPGDTYFHPMFTKLAAVALERARQGNRDVAVVRSPATVAVSQ